MGINMSPLLSLEEVSLIDSILHKCPLAPWHGNRELRDPVALELSVYLVSRAVAEGSKSELDTEFFSQCLRHGFAGFFGISYSSCGIFADFQEPTPGFLDAFLQVRGTDVWARQKLAVGEHF